MFSEWVWRYLHFSGLLLMAGTLFTEWILLQPLIRRKDLRKISGIDLTYGLASLLAVTAGMTMWLDESGKTSEFYSNNPVFLLKLTVVTAVGLLSLPPTFFFLRERKGDPEETIIVPNRILWMVRVELVLFLTIPLMATMMAWGIGY